MSNFIQETQSGKIDLINVLVDIRLTNVTEIKVLQEVVSFIDTHYQEHKVHIKAASVAALILNRQDIPNLYATSPRGYNNQVLEFQNQFGISGFKIREKLIPWAIDKIIRTRLSQNLHLDLTEAKDNQISQIAVDNQNFLEILANIDLANVTEFQVIEEAFNHIQQKFSGVAQQINLSDVCALVLNHKSVCSLYATTTEEYDKLKQIYLSEHQFQVNEIVHQMVEKVHSEGSELSLNHDSLIAVNFQRRKNVAQSWHL